MVQSRFNKIQSPWLSKQKGTVQAETYNGSFT